ncbi:MAG: hypothetical protein K1060chlam1_01430 [Candidatus Anoxychlamydiales bacterium]|nr:hypothetical protein [Candidatus Anoxychlamydiales bacterium]
MSSSLEARGPLALDRDVLVGVLKKDCAFIFFEDFVRKNKDLIKEEVDPGSILPLPELECEKNNWLLEKLIPMTQFLFRAMSTAAQEEEKTSFDFCVEELIPDAKRILAKRQKLTMAWMVIQELFRQHLQIKMIPATIEMRDFAWKHSSDCFYYGMRATWPCDNPYLYADADSLGNSSCPTPAQRAIASGKTHDDLFEMLISSTWNSKHMIDGYVEAVENKDRRVNNYNVYAEAHSCAFRRIQYTMVGLWTRIEATAQAGTETSYHFNVEDICVGSVKQLRNSSLTDVRNCKQTIGPDIQKRGQSWYAWRLIVYVFMNQLGITIAPDSDIQPIEEEDDNSTSCHELVNHHSMTASWFPNNPYLYPSLGSSSDLAAPVPARGGDVSAAGVPAAALDNPYLGSNSGLAAQPVPEIGGGGAAAGVSASVESELLAQLKRQQKLQDLQIQRLERQQKLQDLEIQRLEETGKEKQTELNRLEKRLEELEEELSCSLTLVVMEDPVVASDGNTYERSAIQAVIDRNPDNPTSPLFGSVPITKTLIPNRAVKTRCDEYREIKKKIKALKKEPIY